jgi:hypothetical protein
MSHSDPVLTQQSLNLIMEYQQDLIDRLGLAPYREHLAEQLSKIAGHTPPWTGRYVQSVAAGTLAPSAAFGLAIEAYGAGMDDTPIMVAYTVTVQVLARPGAVIPGSIVLSESRPCAYPGCPTVFVPRVPWQKICNAELHRQAERAQRRAKREPHP